MTSGWVCHICSELLFEVFAASAQLWTNIQYFGLFCSTLSFQTWSCEQSKMKTIRPKSAIEALPEPLYRKLLFGCLNILMNPELTLIPTSPFSEQAFKVGIYQNLNESQFCCLCLHILACTVNMQLSTNIHHTHVLHKKKRSSPKNSLLFFETSFIISYNWLFVLVACSLRPS